jgi:hypothetical protein
MERGLQVFAPYRTEALDRPTSARLSTSSIDGSVNSGKPKEILDFDCPGPAARAYELDPANAGGTIHLTMKWLSPSHLDVSYDGTATVDFQVVKFAGVDISLRDASKERPAPPR